MKTTTILAACALLGSSRVARAESTPPAVPPDNPPTQVAAATPIQDGGSGLPESTALRHNGFFMRAQLGGGFRSMSATSRGTSMTVSGAGAGFAFAAGGAIRENVIFYGEIVVDSAPNPTIEVGTRKAHTTDASFSLIGIGPGITYYLMPANVHLGGSILLTRATLQVSNETIAKTDWGFGGALRFGKDFSINKDFAMGVVAQLSLSSMQDGSGASDAPTWTGMAGGLALAGIFH